MSKAMTPERETLDRLRRIETRVTLLCIDRDIDIPRQQPKFVPLVGGRVQGSIHLPSRHASIAEILSALPAHWTGSAQLLIGGETIGVIDIKDQSA